MARQVSRPLPLSTKPMEAEPVDELPPARAGCSSRNTTASAASLSTTATGLTCSPGTRNHSPATSRASLWRRRASWGILLDHEEAAEVRAGADAAPGGVRPTACHRRQPGTGLSRGRFRRPGRPRLRAGEQIGETGQGAVKGRSITPAIGPCQGVDACRDRAYGLGDARRGRDQCDARQAARRGGDCDHGTGQIARAFGRSDGGRDTPRAPAPMRRSRSRSSIG